MDKFFQKGKDIFKKSCNFLGKAQKQKRQLWILHPIKGFRMTVFIFPLNPLKNKTVRYYTNVGFCKYLF